jgi:RHS repeat-associated protein
MSYNLWRYDSQQGWIQSGTDIPVTFTNGDVFSARALTNGTVEIYRNGNLFATRTVTLSRAPQPGFLFQPVSFNLPSFNLIPLQQGSAVTINYEYDPLHRLKTVTYSDGRSFTYSYDAVGNVLQYTQTQGGSTVTTTYDYNRANQLTTAQADNSPIIWQYVYDANGRLTEVLPDGVPANGAKRYTYHTAGYLVKAEAHDGSAYQPQAEMLYNGLGQRLRMTGYALGTSVTTTYVLDLMDNARPLSATSNGNTTYYVYGLGPVAEFTTEWSYSLPDGTNTPRQLTNEVGEITLAGSYTPWGNSLEYTGTGNFTFGYFGGVMDAATGLLYVGNGQYYDPATGRFLTRDVNPNSTNPYVPWGNPTGAILGPLALLGLIYGRKRKKNGFDYFVIILFVALGVGMGLSACVPAPAPSGTPQPPSIPQSGNSTPVPPASSPNTTPPPPVLPSGTATSIPDQIFPYPCPTPFDNLPTPTGTPTPIQDLDQYFASLPEPYAKMPGKWTISSAGIEFLKKWEHYEGRLYNDGNLPTDDYYYDTKGRGKGNCTIGYGYKVHNLPCNQHPTEDRFKDGISELKADELLHEQAYIKAEVWIKSYVTVRLTQTQYDALVSLYYNWGGDKLIDPKHPDKLTLLNSGQYVATANHIRLGPVTSGGVYFESLQRRRNEEADMFLLPVNFSTP